MAQEYERRTFFRIHDCLVVEFRQITPEDFAKLKDAIQYNSAQVFDGAQEIPFFADKEPTGEHEELFAYMHMLNRKLDTIIDRLTGSQSDEIYQCVRAEISLSGAGVRFETKSALKEGDYTELRMIIPVFPYPKITVLCQVVRTEKVREDSTEPFRVAMKFVMINEKDRDFLVKYVFEKEREFLRQRKENAGQ